MYLARQSGVAASADHGIDIEGIRVYAALVYLTLISQWLGFRFWYRAMTIAGVGVISQFQLLQPFFTLIFSALILSEAIAVSTLLFALLILFFIAAAIRAK